MNKKIFGLIALLIINHWMVRADEGMWLPSLVSKLNMEQMQSLGLKLTADQIYNINNSSLKDAIVALDHGSCTAELVSADGLLLTNHHCGFDEIQKHSSGTDETKNYLRNGFWALSHDQELPNPGKSATFLISVEDVTDKVLKGVSDTMSNSNRMQTIQGAIFNIENEAKGKSNLEYRVRSMFEGNSYYLFVTETFRDIRLVGAPPQSIGKFGGESDNWMWPRHTGDFAMFRIYCSPDGKPADYSKDNVPYHPRHHLPISLKGIEKGDFAMVMGYPGRTTRYLTSFGVKNAMEVTNDVRIKVRGAKLDIIREYMAKNEQNKLQYAAKFASSSNYYKYSIGQNKGLKNLNVIAKKEKIEKEFTEWVNASPERRAKYGMALPQIAAAYQSADDKIAMEYLKEAIFQGGELMMMAAGCSDLYDALLEGDKEKITNEAESFRSQIGLFYKDFDLTTDQKVTAATLKLFAENVNPRYYPGFFEEVGRKYKGDFDAYTAKIYTSTIFASEARLNAFLDNPSAKRLDKDLLFITMREAINSGRKINEDYRKSVSGLEAGRRLFVGGLNEMNAGQKVYPDANSTMRLTYGTVGDYQPADGVSYSYFTTLKGYQEKGIRGDADFDYSQKLIDLYNKGDYGRYADKDGLLHTCFTTNNDITGGNSGSPVMNARGELIGIAFDGNWEAMSGDIAYESKLQKCINVDIRFVLWTIEKIGGAQNLIREMTILE